MNELEKEGWCIDQQAVSDQAAALGDSVPDLRSLLLDSDIKKLGVSCLPTGINHADHLQLKGPHVLQVVSAVDACIPSKGGAGTSKKRLLLLTLTDGKVTVKALEFKGLGNVDINQLPPGTKVQISNALCRCGCILLEHKSFKVLGGRVQALIEAFDFQQRFQGDRAATETSSTDAKAPRFTQYIAGKSRSPNIYFDSGSSPAPSGPPGLGAQAPVTSTQNQAATEDEADKQTSESTMALQKQQAERLESGGALKSQLLQAKAQGAAKFKLTERLQTSQEESRGRGRGRVRRGGRRRGGHDDEDEPGSMTLAEWEARQRPSGRGGLSRDEELALRLQEQFDIEDAAPAHAAPTSSRQTLAEELNQSLFSYSRPEEDIARGGSRGRGRRRGRSRGGSRGRH